MNLTVDHLINVFCTELSSQRVKRFTMSNLIRASEYHKSTVYRYFRDIDHLQRVTYQILFIDEIMLKSDSFEELIENLVTYISENKVLCLNLYYLIGTTNSPEYIIKSLQDQISRFDIGNDIERFYMLSGFIRTISSWFKDELKLDKEIIITELLMYKHLIQQS